MVRKDALLKAIEIVENTELSEGDKEEIVAGLTLCLEELPFAHWSKAAIFDACDQWVQEHGELHLNAFVSAEMPSHPTIKNRFGITAKEFRDTYYPISDITTRSKYYKNGKEEWAKLFVEEFHNIQATGQDDFNRRRNSSFPTWITIAKMFGLKTWKQLLDKFNLSPYKKDRLGRRSPKNGANPPGATIRLIEYDFSKF